VGIPLGGKTRNTYKMLVRKQIEKCVVGRLRRRLEENINI
jgi:hypothetical protein